MAEASPLPLYDIGVELVESCSGVLDAYKKHPAIELAKVTLAVLGLRLDLVKSELLSSPTSSAAAVPRFAHAHPFVTWLSSFATAYAGSILGCILTGDSILQPFTNASSLLYATIAFFVVFFSPFDLFARLFLLRPFNILLAIAAEIYRVGNIVGGVRVGAAMPLASSASFPAPLLIGLGVAKGAGSSLLLPVIRLLRTGSMAGGWSGHSNEILRPSLFLKATFWAALLMTAFQMDQLPEHVTYPIVHVFLHAFFVLLRLAATLLPDPASLDPFKTPEWILGIGLWGISVQWLASSASAAAESEGKSGGGALGGRGPAAPAEFDKQKAKTTTTTTTKKKSKKDE